MIRSSASFFLLSLLALSSAAPRIALAAQSYDNCTGFITSVPAVITTQGTWCLKQDLATSIASGNAITVNTNNVTIDCNDFKLGGLAAGVGTTASGIYSMDRVNTTIRHCNIRGFEFGIFLDGTVGGGNVIEDNRLDANTSNGIRIFGDGSTVRRNLVFDTGGTTVTPSAYGIVSVYGVDIRDNTVSGVTATSGGNGSAFGITTLNAAASSVENNRVRGVLADGAGAAYAINNFSTGRIVLRGNDVLGDAATGSFGIVCVDVNGSAENNEINGFDTALHNCSDDGDNTVHP
jgi:hypothetical protein